MTYFVKPGTVYSSLARYSLTSEILFTNAGGDSRVRTLTRGGSLERKQKTTVFQRDRGARGRRACPSGHTSRGRRCTRNCSRKRGVARESLRYQAAIDALAFGLVCFDGDARLLFCNRQYAEAFGLQPDAAVRGATLGEIIARHSNTETVDDYLAFCLRLAVGSGPRKYDLALVDGRTHHIQHWPLAEGGWVAIGDASERQVMRSLEGERLSLQTLIDLVPDNLWVKDAESRFVLSNNATAQRMGLESWRDAVGKTDLELCPPETAQKYYADERKIVATGRAMVEMEEYLLEPDGSKTWILTTKVPVRSRTGEVVGVVGISHDITQRKLWETLRDGQAEFSR